MSLVSIIIPVYKVEEYIRECLLSVINQSYKDLEIIVVDDGSPDHSADIVREYIKCDNRIKLIQQENGGLSAARNTGLANATGEYVFFLDSDDLLDTDAVSVMYEIFNKHEDLDMVVCSHFCFQEKDDINKIEAGICSTTIRTGREWLLVQPTMVYSDNIEAIDFITAWGNLYKKNVLNGFEFPVGKLHEDEFTTYRLLYDSDKVAYVNMPLYGYRQRAGSIMNAKKSEQNQRHIIMAMEERLIFYTQRGETELASKTVIILMTYLLNLLSMYKKNNTIADYNEMRNRFLYLYKNDYDKDFAKFTTQVRYWIYVNVPWAFKILQKIYDEKK